MKTVNSFIVRWYAILHDSMEYSSNLVSDFYKSQYHHSHVSRYHILQMIADLGMPGITITKFE